MAEKHKSKYKKPENTKYKSRKDLKDYTTDDKKGGLNPMSTGEKQSNVLRKTDKEVVDNGDMYVKYNADDRLYKDLEDGEYDPKHAAKVLKKRQDKDETDNAKNIKDKIENLTREGKEYLIREYIFKKTFKMLLEQPTPEEEPVAEEPTDAPAEDPTAAPDMTAPAPDMTAPAPDATAAPTPTTPAPASAAPAPAVSKTTEQLLGSELQSANNFERIGKIKEVIGVALEKAIETEEPAAVNEFYKFLIKDLIKQRHEMFAKFKNKK